MTEAAFLAKWLKAKAELPSSAPHFQASHAMLRALKKLCGALPAPDIAIPIDHLTPNQAREIVRQLEQLDARGAA